MASLNIRVTGFDSLNRKLVIYPADVAEVVRREIKSAALNIESTAKQLAPVDTGRLRNSITHDIRDNGHVAVIGTNVEYAPFVEFGTRRAPAQPFLFPAFQRERRAFARRLQRAIDRVGRRLAA